MDLVVPETEEQYQNEDAVAAFRDYLKGKGVEFMEVSSARRMGISKMLDHVVELLQTLKEGE